MFFLFLLWKQDSWRTFTKEVRNYSVEQDTGYGNCPHNTCQSTFRYYCQGKKLRMIPKKVQSMPKGLPLRDDPIYSE